MCSAEQLARAEAALWALQRHPNLWEDPDAFIPARWVEGTPEAAKVPHPPENRPGAGRDALLSPCAIDSWAQAADIWTAASTYAANA